MRNGRYLSEKDRFKRAEMANELAHEDAENDRARPNGTEKSRNFKAFMKLKGKGENRSHTEDLEFTALKKRYGWY